MAQDINNFIDPKLIETLEKLNKNLVEIGNTIDKDTIPAIKDIETELTKTGKTIEETTEKRKRLTKAERDARDLEETLISNEQKIQSLKDGTAKKIIEQREAIRKLTAVQRDQLRSEQAEEGSLIRMRLRLKELTAEYDKAGVRTKAATKEINDLSKSITKAEQATNRHGRNVGNYTSVWDKFKGITSAIPGQLGNIAQQGEGIVTKLASLGPVGGVVASTIIAAGAQLTAFFTKTEKGAEMLERKWAGMKAAWSVLVGELASGGEKIADTFEENNKQSTFWTGVLSALSPALTGLGVRMDLASKAAETYTLKIQQLEDAERATIVPRAEANNQIKKAMELYYDESKSLEVRMNALKQAVNLENQTADAEIERQKLVVENIRIINEEKKKAGQLRDEDDKKLQEAIATQINLETESIGRTLRTQKRINTAQEEIIKGEQARSKAEKEAAEKRAKIWADETWAKQEQKNEQLKINEKYLEDFAKLIDSEIELEDAKQAKLIEATIAAGEKIFDEQEKLREKDKEATLKAEEQKRQTRDELIQQSANLGTALFDLKISQLNREFMAAEGNAKKQAEISNKIAKAERNKALFDIAINTAVAIVKALPNIPLSILAGSIGLVQAGIVAAKPIPQFAKGTNFAPGGVSLVGEKGRELIQRRNGEIYLANNPALVNLERGSKVFNNRKTEMMLNDRNILTGLNRVETAIKRMPQPIFRNGSKIAERNGNYWKTYINQKHRQN